MNEKRGVGRLFAETNRLISRFGIGDARRRGHAIQDLAFGVQSDDLAQSARAYVLLSAEVKDRIRQSWKR